MKIKYVFCLLMFLWQSLSTAQVLQENIDSLLTEYQRLGPDTNRVRLLEKLASHYNVAALDSARAFAVEGIDLAERLKDVNGRWSARNVLGTYHERKAQYDSALIQYDNALKIIDSLNSVRGYAVVLNNKATVFIRQAKYEEALSLLFRALEAEEQLGNKEGVAQAYNNIGVVYYYSQNFDKTTEYLTKALEIQEELGKLDGLILGYNNVGAIRDYQQKYQEAIGSYQKALDISKQLGDVKQEAIAWSNIALARAKMGDLAQAEADITTALALRDKASDPQGKVQSQITFGQVLQRQKRFGLAKSYFEKALEVAKSNDLLLLQREALTGLSDLATENKNFQAATGYLNEIIVIKDSITNKENAEAMAEMETKYQTQQKENQILEQRAELAEAKLINRRRTALLVGSLGLAFLFGLIGFLVYKQQRLKNEQLQKEAELRTALAKIETQNSLQEQRLRISRDLHDNIGAQLTFIISSLDNLKYGFKDMEEKLKGRLSGISSFTSQTIYELRDTIWAMNKDNISLEDLKTRITNFMDQAKASTQGIAFDVKLDPSLDPDYSFKALTGMNLYRIIQESVNNSLKYADPTKIELQIDKTAEGFNLVVSDNGKGFDEKEIEAGNGLGNMRKRARELQANLDIKSAPGAGTQVQLSLPAQ
ncbi:tetratricopeptide repeat-containing sensor histidine kinase [Gilvibacter sp.]|uniref:tetratricopeptide repeat-containing sensor histidine kinase n=1 Tax=Gilvibacter sp. TaxID=2729997 RepID=UPI003F4A1306